MTLNVDLIKVDLIATFIFFVYTFHSMNQDFLGEIDDNLIFKEKHIAPCSNYEERLAVKVIILDDTDRIAFVGTKYRLLPGGGVEKGETLETATKREALEETGCNIDIIDSLGFVIENKQKICRRQKTFCFVAKVNGIKGMPTTHQENEKGIEVDWVALEEVSNFLQNQNMSIPVESYHSRFNVYNNILFFTKFKKVAWKKENT